MRGGGGNLKIFLSIALIFLCRVMAYGDDTAVPDNVHAWSREEADVLRSLWIGSLPPPPKDPSNAYSENRKAARLGEKIFAGPLSPDCPEDAV